MNKVVIILNLLVVYPQFSGRIAKIYISIFRAYRSMRYPGRATKVTTLCHRITLFSIYGSDINFTTQAIVFLEDGMLLQAIGKPSRQQAS